MLIADLLTQLPDICHVGAGVEPTAVLQGARSDTRFLRAQDLFIALPGVRSQGVDYLAEALERGCRAALVPNDVELPAHLARYCIGVDRIRYNAALAACAVYNQPTRHLLTFGVTGTNGKTSTCHILKHLLEAAGHRVVMLTTVAHEYEGWRRETPNTTPDAALLQETLDRARRQGATAAVLEVSAHGVLLDRIAGSVFDGLVFTNLSLDHQDFFDGIEPYFAQKLRLFTEARFHKPACVAAIGAADEFGHRIHRATALPHLTFGESVRPDGDPPDITVATVTASARGLQGRLSVRGQIFAVDTTLSSDFNRYNIAGALAVAVQAGLSAEALRLALTQAIRVPGRLMCVPGTAPFQVIVDFAHTDSALGNLLQGLRKDCTGKLIVVFGAGGDKDPARRFTLPRVVIDLADVGIITLDNPRSEPPKQIIDTMVGHWRELARTHASPALLLVEPDRKAAIVSALQQATAGDVVVLAGKGHETTQIFADRIEPHDDFALASAWLTARGLG